MNICSLHKTPYLDYCLTCLTLIQHQEGLSYSATIVPKIMEKKFETGYKTCYIDVDDTLVVYNSPKFYSATASTVDYKNGKVYFVRNQNNIDLLKHFYSLGYDILVWSKTGADWARLVCESIKVDKFVSAYLTKPTFYIDDKDVEEWIGPREWRKP